MATTPSAYKIIDHSYDVVVVGSAGAKHVPGTCLTP